MDVKQRALLWGHLIITLPAVAVLISALLFRKYLFVPCWPYYLTIGLALAYQWHITAISRWHRALIIRGFSAAEVEKIAHEGGIVIPGSSSVGLLALHTTAVGLCATYLSLWLAGGFVHWVLPFIGAPTPPSAIDFYLQHFEFANIIPAFLLGCVIVRKFPDLSTWAWLLPIVVVLYKLFTFNDPTASVLTPGKLSHSFSYYFVVQRDAPRWRFAPTLEISGPDPVRFLEQLTVVAPLYCGVAYSVGAFATRSKGLQRIWGSLSRDPEPEIIEPEKTAVVGINTDSVREPPQP